MNRIRPDQPLVPSLLDRLLDDDPQTTREPPKSRNQVLRDLKQSIRRDLENLLNTRWRATNWPPELSELSRSLVNYGLPDIAGTELGSKHTQQEFRRTMEDVIQRFEPRLGRVHVALLENTRSWDRMLRFRIDAIMYAEPAPEPVVFDSSLETATGNIQVKGSQQ